MTRKLYIIIIFCYSFVLSTVTAIAQQSTTGPEPPPGIDRGLMEASKAQVVIPGVPSYLWRHGCGPTALGMVIGYWDTYGPPVLVPGDATSQTTAVNAMIADDSQSPGCGGTASDHYQDYACPIDYSPNLLPDRSHTGGAHANNCVADFMYTSRSSRGNYYGWSWFEDVGPSFVQYVRMRDPAMAPVATNYYFEPTSWLTYKAEIDASRPVVLLVDTDGDNETDHFVTGIGYDSGNMQYGVYDTWNRDVHWYNWAEMTTGRDWGVFGFTAFRDVNLIHPYYTLDSSRFDDDDGDGFFESGETVRFYFFMRNLGPDDANAVMTLSSENLDVVFTDPNVFFASVPGQGAAVNNLAAPIEFVVPFEEHPVFAEFTLDISSDDTVYARDFTFEVILGRTEILLVDDDRGNVLETVYYDDLRARNVPAHVWEKSTQGSPPGAKLAEYNTVIWFTCDSTDDFLQPADMDAMKAYMDGGGNLFLTGQGLPAELTVDDPAFLNDYLHCQYAGVNFYYEHRGIDDSPIGDGLLVRYFGGALQALSMADVIIPVNGALPAFEYSNTPGAYSALTYAGDYKLVFFAWGYEALGDFAAWDSRDTVLSRILTFLNGWNGERCVDSDNDGYGDPGHPENGCPTDNCPDVYNPDQVDTDSDGIGDACEPYICGDASGDSNVNLLDILYLISFKYDNPPGPAPDYPAAADVNMDGSVNLLDILYLIAYLYSTPPGPAPCDNH